MSSLPRKVKDIALAHENARALANTLTESTQRFEAILAELDAEIERQKCYLENRHIPTDTDLALLSLQQRRANVAHSLESLRRQAPAVEEALREATQLLTQIGEPRLRSA